MAIANIPNLSYRIPNMDLLNDAGGAAMGFINGVVLTAASSPQAALPGPQ